MSCGYVIPGGLTYFQGLLFLKSIQTPSLMGVLTADRWSTAPRNVSDVLGVNQLLDL